MPWFQKESWHLSMYGKDDIMYKGNCLNPQINRLMSELGHTDTLCICDAGLPIPSNVERVDLAWKKDKPKWLEVCELVKDNIYIEKVYLSEDMKTKSKKMHDEFIRLFEENDVEIIYIKHDDFKKNVSDCKGVIRSGEFTAFANCIFSVGVAF